MRTFEKNWNRHVVHGEEIARTEGFQRLRELILARAEIQPHEEVLDIGAGTGLLTLPAAGAASSVWAVDISGAMCEYLSAKALSAGLDNIEVVCASAASLPLVDSSVDVVVSNYCFHHLDGAQKVMALSEVFRVLRPGGRFVMADMMFNATLSDARSRQVVSAKLRAMLRRGPQGALRVAKNAIRYATGSWEKPAPAEWWESAIQSAGFEFVEVGVLNHEGGIAFAIRPATR